MANSDDVNKLLKKVDTLTKEKKLDLSSDEDLSIGIMNLIAIEEHLFFTAEKTGKSSYLDLLNEVRQMRKELLQKIIKDYEGEIWCCSKHLLAASMRLMEVGTKELGKGNKKSAEDLFDKAYKLYSLFWGINLKVINTDTSTSLSASTLNKVNFINEQGVKKGSNSIFDKLGVLVQKAIDCCRE